MDKALELIISVYNDPDQAKATLKALRHEAGHDTFKIKDAAVITKDKEGHAHIHDSEDVKPGHGALFGAITGAVVGMMAGPAGVVVGAAAGAATGGVTAKALDFGFPDEQLKAIRAGLAPNSSALVVLVEHTWAEKLVHEMEKSTGKLYRHAVDPALVDEYEREALRR
jgi:uncharacterized membrane protein